MSRKTEREFRNYLQRGTDLPSVKEAIDFHLTNIFSDSGQTKRFITKDPDSLAIAKKLIKKSGLENLGILDPDLAEKSKKHISKIEIIPLSEAKEEYIKAYFLSEETAAIVAVGGPSAQATALLLALSKQQVIYINAFWNLSNAAHSANQLHNRHGVALAYDLAGHALLPLIFKRHLLTNKAVRKQNMLAKQQLLAEILKADYPKIDLDIKQLSWSDFVICLHNELLWLRNKFREFLGKATDYDYSHRFSVIAQKIHKIIYSITKQKLTTDTDNKASSIQIAVSAAEDSHLQKNNKDFQRKNIFSEKLSHKEMIMHFGSNYQNEIYSAYKYFGDSAKKFSAFNDINKIIQEQGSKTLLDKQLSKLYVAKNAHNKLVIAAAEFTDINNNRKSFIKLDKIYLSLGYTGRITYKSHNLNKAINSNVTVGTGCSVNCIFKNDAKTKKLLKEFSKIPEYAVTNSHWTLIDYDEEHILMRMTAGGMIASHKYSSATFLNLLANTRRIFKDQLIAIVSTYACPRWINKVNDGQFVKTFSNMLIAEGHGGNGITQSNARAYAALNLLDVKIPELDKYLSKDEHELLKETAIRDTTNKEEYLSKIIEKDTKFLSDIDPYK